jgi:ABC-type microcin C transport system permease subunit YejE
MLIDAGFLGLVSVCVVPVFAGGVAGFFGGASVACPSETEVKTTINAILIIILLSIINILNPTQVAEGDKQYSVG